MDFLLDINQLLFAIRRRIPLLLALFVVVFGIGAAVAYMLPAVYRSQATILVESQQIPEDLVRSTVTSLPDERIQVIEQRVMTRSNILTIIDKFDLYRNQRGQLTTTELVQKARESTSIRRIRLDGGNRRSNRFSVAFTVGFEHEVPKVASQVANELVTLILEENVRTRTSRASETTRFLVRETERREEDLRRIELQITEFKKENESALPESLDYRLSFLERMERRLIDVNTEIQNLDRDQRLFELGLSTSGSQSVGLPEEAFSTRRQLTQRLNQLQSELVRKAAVFSDSHPVMRSLNQEIKNIEAELDATAPDETQAQGDGAGGDAPADDAQTIVAEFQAETFRERRTLLEEQRKELQDSIDEVRVSIGRTPDVQLGLNALEREYANIRSQYEELIAKQAAAELGESLEEDNNAERFEVIEQPTVPQIPVRPNRMVILAMAFVVAAGISGGSVLGLELMNTSVQSVGQLQRVMNRRPIVAIPYVRNQEDVRRSRRKIGLSFAAATLAFAAGVAGLHFLAIPLDELLLRIQAKL